jgi:hypothetical protein
MATNYASILLTDPRHCYEELDNLKKAMHDPDYEPLIDKTIAESKARLEAGNVQDAELKYTEAKLMIERADASNHARPQVWRLFWLEICYLAILLFVGYLSRVLPSSWTWATPIKDFIQAAWFGALGGVTIGLFGLYSHLQARDFDSKYELWYICKPIMGAIFGWFVFMVFFVGMLAVGTQTGVPNPLLLYVIAFLAGFSERFTIKIVDRIMQVLMTWEDKTAGSSAGAQNL